jgi:hypothetical protein
VPLASETACPIPAVKTQLLASFATTLDECLSAPPIDERSAELAVWKTILTVGAELLTTLLTLACRRAFEDASAGGDKVRLRLDDDYHLTRNTTLGPIRVPLFAYRGTDGRTRAPARQAVFPLHPKVHSSELLLQWETSLGIALPFRQAEEALHFFTHGAADIEDNTIARHVAAIGAAVGPAETYREPTAIARLLRECATRDGRTGRPLLYLSTDAHALRRYVDESFDTAWKMINGIRMWCVHEGTGDIIHLGGEYTWGDCREVAARFEHLLSEYVPVGDAAPQVVFITDGMTWIRDHVVPVLPQDTLLILDFFHVMEHLAEHARARFGAGSKEGRSWYSKARASLLGRREYRRRSQKKRKGHKKRVRPTRRRRTIHLSDNRFGAGEALARSLIAEGWVGDSEKSQDALLGYVAQNAGRMDYPAYRQRGIQIGSGAMESLHRTASQMRLKLAGARWLGENALAILNLRLMRLAGNWDSFWNGPGTTQTLARAFELQQAT